MFLLSTGSYFIEIEQEMTKIWQFLWDIKLLFPDFFTVSDATLKSNNFWFTQPIWKIKILKDVKQKVLQLLCILFIQFMMKFARKNEKIGRHLRWKSFRRRPYTYNTCLLCMVYEGKNQKNNNKKERLKQKQTESGAPLIPIYKSLAF